MFLVLKPDPDNPAGWTPVAITATKTAKQAAEETGGVDQLAVVAWQPEYYGVELTRTVSKLTEQQATNRLEPQVRGAR